MPEARLQRTRETLPKDYQFGQPLPCEPSGHEWVVSTLPGDVLGFVRTTRRCERCGQMQYLKPF